MPIGVYKHKPNQGFQKGHPCYSYNLRNLSEESKEKRKLSKKGKHYSPNTEFKKGHISIYKGKKLPKMTGSNHPNWQGGKANHLYGPGWTITLKEKIKARDAWKCQVCEVPQEECLKTLVVHHIDYNKKNLNHNNLITLCRTCHNKTNTNRKYWEVYFKNRRQKNENIYSKLLV